MSETFVQIRRDSTLLWKSERTENSERTEKSERKEKSERTERNVGTTGQGPVDVYVQAKLRDNGSCDF